ncbi:hypothetical protein JYQ62_28500 [Nostoc sp. UHCC 0702]|nr:hypothetical protein JYQ62_28500 [Nostoc sp. UHCC 0702]
MPYITSVERRGIQKGLEQGIEQGKRQGLIEGIRISLQIKFRSEAITILPEIAEIQNVDTLSAILNSIETVNSIEELRQIYQ